MKRTLGWILAGLVGAARFVSAAEPEQSRAASEGLPEVRAALDQAKQAAQAAPAVAVPPQDVKAEPVVSSETLIRKRFSELLAADPLLLQIKWSHAIPDPSAQYRSIFVSHMRMDFFSGFDYYALIPAGQAEPKDFVLEKVGTGVLVGIMYSPAIPLESPPAAPQR